MGSQGVGISSQVVGMYLYKIGVDSQWMGMSS
jgi:hypothetical protein